MVAVVPVVPILPAEVRGPEQAVQRLPARASALSLGCTPYSTEGGRTKPMTLQRVALEENAPWPHCTMNVALVDFRVAKGRDGAHFVPDDPDPREHKALEPPAIPCQHSIAYIGTSQTRTR